MVNKFRAKALDIFTLWTRVLNEMTLDQARHTFLYFRNLLWIAPTVVWVICLAQLIVPLGTLSFSIFTFFCWIILAVSIIASCFVNWFLILLTTRRTDKGQDERVDLMWGELSTGLWQESYIFGASIALPLSMTLIPFLQYLSLRQKYALGNTFLTRMIILGIAVMAMFYLHSRLNHTVYLFEKRIRNWMADYQFHYQPLRQMLSGLSEEEIQAHKHEPTMILGYSIETGDLVVQSVEARKRNSIVLGPIGAGKTSTWFRPQIVQDITHFIYYMRDYARVSKDPKWEEPYGLQATYFNGFAVVETTNDLCRTVYNDAIAMGIPEEKIRWFDPTNPDTPSLNLLRGPTNAVSQNVTDVLTGLKQSNNDFFSQAERTYLVQHIYLLKEASIIDAKPASFSELYSMTADVHLVVRKMKQLEAYVEILQLNKEKAKAASDAQPDDKALSAKYSDLSYNYDIALETLQWFQNNIYAEQFKTGVKVEQSGPYKGYPKYVDKQEQFVGGLINTLTDLSKEVGVRRVLFSTNSDFNLDDFMKNGGILLCNTAKDDLGATLSKILGQIYTLSIQSATFRRRPNIDPMFALYMDEFPDYLSTQFPAFAAQARKYNVPINIGAQSPAQLSREFGPDYLKTILSVMLTRATFGDMGAEDAKQLEPMFGEHDEAVESIDDQDIDLAADQAQNRRRINTRIEKVPNISAAEIMGMEKFTMAIRTPGDTRSNIYDHIKTHLITDKTVAENPENFDIDDEDDFNAYENMQKALSHDNPDYSPIEKEILDQIQNGEYVIQWPTEEQMKSGEDILPIILDSEGNVLAGEGSSDSNASSGTDTVIFDQDVDLGDTGSTSTSSASKVTKIGGKKAQKNTDYSSEAPLGSTGVEDNITDTFDDDLLSVGTALDAETANDKKSSNSDDNLDDLLNTNDPLDDAEDATSNTNASKKVNSTLKDNAKNNVNYNISNNTQDKLNDNADYELDALDASVKKSPNSGNNRFDNNLGVAATPETISPISTSRVGKVGKVRTNSSKSKMTNASQGQKAVNNTKAVKIDDTEVKSASSDAMNAHFGAKMNDKKGKEDEDMLIVDENNQLVDKPITQRPIAGSRENTIKDLKKSAIIEMQKGFNDIIKDSKLTEAQKLSQMKIFRNDQKKKLTNLFPNDIDKVIDRIDQAIIKQQDKVNNLHPKLDGTDSVQSANRKFEENDDAHGDELSNDLNNMLKEFNQDASSNFSYEEDTPFDNKDPFQNQPGMNDPFDSGLDPDEPEKK